jgi:outer membrane lipoprotein SlyB
MTTMNRFGSVLVSVLGIVGVLTLGACETMNESFHTSGPGTAYPGTANSESAYSGYGVVDSIERVSQGSTGIGGSGIGVGTIAGAVVGGLLGYQVGSGTGQTVATVAGAAGGAYVGHELENRQQHTADTYKFTIRMNNGSYQTLMQNTDTGFRVGDRVRVENGYLQRY